MITRPLPAVGVSGLRGRLHFLLMGLPALLGLRPGVHPIHVSVCELRLNEKTRAVEVSLKLYIDDLEATLQADGFPDLQIGTEKESDLADKAIANYIARHLRIEADGRGLQPVYHGKEITEDYLAVWCYVEFPNLAGDARACRIVNDMLMELYDDQKNIMDIRMSPAHKAYTIFEKGRSAWSYTF